MDITRNAFFTMVEIAQASGRSEDDIAQRVKRRTTMGILKPIYVPGLRGRPRVFTYDDVKTILWKVKDTGHPAMTRTDLTPDPDLIYALRHQLQTDGFRIYDTPPASEEG